MVDERQMTIADVGAMPDRAEVESAERLRSRGVQRIPVSAVIVEERIRQDMGDIAGLAESILKSGLLHPIVVDESYRLLAGERRLRAHMHAGLDEIDARVFAGLTDLEKEVVELHENERRKDFAANELARYYVQKKEYVEAALKLLKAQEQRRIAERAAKERERQRRDYEKRLMALEKREEEVAAKLAEFDARLEREEERENSQDSAPYRTEIAKRMGIDRGTLSNAEAHVAAMDKYPFLDHRTWKQQLALEVAAALDAIEAEQPDVHPVLARLLTRIDDPKKIRQSLRFWGASSPEKRQAMGALLLGEQGEAREQVEAYLSGNNLQADIRRVALHGIIPKLQECQGTQDSFRPRFERLLVEAQALYDAIREAEEANYGWLRAAGEDR